MITNELLERVFWCRNTVKSATCFSLLEDGKIYYITAKHFLEAPETQGWIEIFYKDNWRRCTLKNIKHSPVSDISIFSIDWEIGILPIKSGMDGLTYAQDVYFLGFPYAYSMDVGDFNRGFPFPLAKAGIVSCMFMSRPGKSIFIDGHSNSGFSGGPLIFKNLQNGILQIGGVISKKIDENKPVFEGKNDLNLTDFHIQENSGIIIAYSIENALNLIKGN